VRGGDTNFTVVRSQEPRYTGDSAFSYTCHACRRSCYDKIIHLNPYEVARLAQNRGIGTSAFFAQHTDAAGIALKRVEGGACVKGNGFWNRFPSFIAEEIRDASAGEDGANQHPGRMSINAFPDGHSTPHHTGVGSEALHTRRRP